MDPVLNPYSPGSGVAPRVLAGRDPDIAAFQTLVTRTGRSLPARPIILSGLRGVGKTVLLNRLRGLADANDWLTIQFEARPGSSGKALARRSLAQGLIKASSTYRTRAHLDSVKRMLASISSFSIGVGVEGVSLGVERDLSRASTGSLEMDLQDVVEDIGLTIRGEGKGLCIFIDEMQDLDDELTEALIATQHFANQRELPFFLIGAGLPSLPAHLAASRSYAERLFEYRTIDRLTTSAAHDSLAGPAEQLDASYTPEAMEVILRESGCYPYFLQEFGSAMWTVAERSPFSKEAAQAAAIVGKSSLDAGFFPSRWDRATPAERDYLSAMAVDGEGPSLSGDVATRMGKRVQSLGPARAGLINKGLIYSPEHGKIAFTVPGMADFIRRRDH